MIQITKKNTGLEDIYFIRGEGEMLNFEIVLTKEEFDELRWKMEGELDYLQSCKLTKDD